MRLKTPWRIAIAFCGSVGTVSAYFYAKSIETVAALSADGSSLTYFQRQARFGTLAAIFFEIITIVIVAPLVPPQPSEDYRYARMASRFAVSTVLCVSAAVLLRTITLTVYLMLHP
jgi:hypothetical protein